MSDFRQKQNNRTSLEKRKISDRDCLPSTTGVCSSQPAKMQNFMILLLIE